MEKPADQHISLSALAARVNAATRSAFPSEIWVVGEISQCQINASGHCYLNLVERAEAGASPLAEFRAAIWAAKYSRIEHSFNNATGMALQNGMKVLLRVAVNYHPVYGLSLIVSDIDPNYTIGESERERRATIARLEKEGKMNLQREFALPLVAQRFAVISSATAAGYEDFVKQIDSSSYNIHYELFAAMMQGDQTEGSVKAALDRILLRQTEFDGVIIIRGGGSASDLRWFDSYGLCAAIAQFSLPVLTGIGHEKDTSVADMVAFHSFKTPTAVAAGLVERMAVVDGRFDKMKDAVVSTAQNLLLAENNRLNKLAISMQQLTLDSLHSARLRLEKVFSATKIVASTVVAKQSSIVEQREQTVRNLAFAAIERARNMLDRQLSTPDMAKNIILLENGRLTRAAAMMQQFTTNKFHASSLELGRLVSLITINTDGVVARQTNLLAQRAQTVRNLAFTTIEKTRTTLTLLSEKIESRNPRKILKMGYSIVVATDGHVVKTVSQAPIGTLLNIELSDGIIKTEVK
ncbi:MAG: exodeoxyribonuclease VII large subunit [Mucinivorans sp.]